MRARERKRESKREREREREREVFGGRENEGKSETLKHLKAFFFFFLNYGKGWVEFGYIVFGLNWAQWVFS